MTCHLIINTHSHTCSFELSKQLESNKPPPEGWSRSPPSSTFPPASLIKKTFWDSGWRVLSPPMVHLLCNVKVCWCFQGYHNNEICCLCSDHFNTKLGKKTHQTIMSHDSGYNQLSRICEQVTRDGQSSTHIAQCIIFLTSCFTSFSELPFSCIANCLNTALPQSTTTEEQ